MKTTSQIRSTFLDYFNSQGHEVVPSSALVPANDPTLLFTNAGMVQFKDVFLGAEHRGYQRAVTAQRCVRAGGKHNDLDQVGYTARHHTFFEMLGNFSFGDYFKKDAIRFAWGLLTDVFEIDSTRLWVTVYESDDEAFEIWRDDVHVPADRIIRIGDKPGGQRYESDNFWAMGDTGPCGPCTEIFYDHGEDIPGGPPGSKDEDGDRFVEIWNLVFMQFDRDAKGEFTDLPKPCVDTGMGLERITALLQGTHDNYAIDLFQHLIAAASRLTGTKDQDSKALRVISDHIRACAFLIMDGVLPANEGRGYVLRRIIRRAVRYGFRAGQKKPFFNQMVEPLCEIMGEAYPELAKQKAQIEQVLLDEEVRFAKTLDTGLGILAKVMDKAQESDQVIAGDTAFLLYDTYGFPLDLTQDIARESGMTVDLRGFDSAMSAQKERARSAGKFQQAEAISAELIKNLPTTVFHGYDTLKLGDVQVVGILVDGQGVEAIAQDEQAILILDHTPFYAESGGQVGDTGYIDSSEGRFRVEDTIKLAGTFHGHVGRVESGRIEISQEVIAAVDEARRGAIVLHHSATHLLHAALRDILGEHVEQRGSLVAADHLRFDFSHPRQVSTKELQQIERRVNADIRENPPTTVAIMDFDSALETGAVALFGEKYGDKVRVMKFGELSVELCGGTHVKRVGDIGQFKILAESAIGAGIRRIEAVAGAAALDSVQQIEARLQNIASLLRVGSDKVDQRLEQILSKSKEMEKEISALKSSLASSGSNELLSGAVEVNGVHVLAARQDGLDAAGLRNSVDYLKSQFTTCAVVIASVENGKVRIAAGVTRDLLDTIKSGELVNFVARQVGGKGGGRPDFAQAGGTQPENLEDALASVAAWVERKSS